MASTDNEAVQPIIVKKIKKAGHGHHGGAWKVAYADFVTAMMAFFLLMWLLNVTTKEEKNAISNYFDPSHPRVSSSMSGSGGILGGMAMSPDGAQVSNVQNLAVPNTPSTPKSGMAKGKQSDQLGTSDYEGDTFDAKQEGRSPSDTDKTAQTEEDGNDLRNGMNVLQEVQNIEDAELEQLQAMIDAEQNESFEEVKHQILEEVEKSPELADLMDHLMIDITPEGLRIQIIDKEGRSMFPIGSADMYGFMNQLVEKVTQVVIPQSNQISVRGHTDGKPYPAGAKYNNWNLSSDRALSSQSAMIAANMPIDRIENVIGKADREHLLPDDPLSERNRRISIVLLRRPLENADEIRKAAANAIKNQKQRVEAQHKELKRQTEDRENIPEMDRTIKGTETRIEQDNANEAPDPIANEIRKFEEQKNKRRAPQLSAPQRSPDSQNDIQVLEF